jgi:hypothetical protein
MAQINDKPIFLGLVPIGTGKNVVPIKMVF